MARTTVPRSIHDSDASAPKRARRARRKSGTGRGVRKVAAVALAVAGACGLGYSVFTAVGSPSPADSSLSEAPSAQERFVDVLVDGWSVRTLEGRALTAQVGDGAPVPLLLEPVDAPDVAELLATSPDLVEQVLARQVTAAGDLTCDADGCSTSEGKLDTADLLLSSGSDAALMLRAHGIESGLLTARVTVPAGAGTVTLTADGYQPLSLPVSPARAGDGPDAELAPAALGNGFQRGRWLVAAGLGHLFTPDAAWLGAPTPRAAQPGEATGALPADAVVRLTGDAPAISATSGLGAPLETAADWTASQLTLATSPTMGCAAGVLCYPGVLDVTTQAQAPVVTAVASDDQQGVVVIDDRVVKVTLPAPIRQMGVEGHLSGQVELRFLTAALHGGSGLSVVDFAGLVDTGDRVAYAPDQVLQNVTLAGRTWHVAP